MLAWHQESRFGKQLRSCDSRQGIEQVVVRVVLACELQHALAEYASCRGWVSKSRDFSEHLDRFVRKSREDFKYMEDQKEEEARREEGFFITRADALPTAQLLNLSPILMSGQDVRDLGPEFEWSDVKSSTKAIFAGGMVPAPVPAPNPILQWIQDLFGMTMSFLGLSRGSR